MEGNLAAPSAAGVRLGVSLTERLSTLGLLVRLRGEELGNMSIK